MQISGRIVALQEQRFRVLADSGQVYLLTLGRDAPLDAGALAELHARGAHLTVDYTGEANLATGVAHAVREDGR